MTSLTSAVAVIVSDDAGRVLLCQKTQGHRRWGLPGGRIRPEESPVHAAVRDVRAETGMETEMVDLVGIYQLTGGEALPDVLVHVFRARAGRAEATVNAPGVICRLSWHDPVALPETMTPVTRAALADAVAGRSGVLRTVRRDAEPQVPDATETEEVRVTASIGAWSGTPVTA